MTKTVIVNCSCGYTADVSKEARRVNLKKNGTYLCHPCACKKAGADGKYSGSKEVRSAASKRMWQDADFRANVLASLPEWTDEKRSVASANTKAAWDRGDFNDLSETIKTKFEQDKDYRVRVSEGLKRKYKEDSGYIAKIAKAASKRCTKEYRKAMSERTRKQMTTDAIENLVIKAKKWHEQHKVEFARVMADAGEVIAVGCRRRWTNVDERCRQSEITTKLWEDEEYRKKVLRSLRITTSSKEFRETASRISTARWSDPEYQKTMALIRSQQPRVSSIQTILYSMLDDLSVKYFREHEDKSADLECTIGPWTFDCVVPRINRPTLLIECNGDYWHSISKAIIRDAAKASYIANNFGGKYELKCIWEHEFACQDKVKELLKYWLGIKDANIIEYSLTDLILKKCFAQDYRPLLSKYHYLPNAGRGGMAYGAYLGDELVAVCVFSPPIRQNIKTYGHSLNEVCELSRLCVNPKFRMKNLLSWFVPRCIRLLPDNLKIVVSYSDTTYNHDGAVYKACNFRLDGEIPPDYWYISDDGWVMHKRTLYGKASKFGMTETDFAQKLGYHRSYGSKKLRFVFIR